jgi:GntR family transcriptional regulator
MAMWHDIADALRDAMTRGDYPPGSTIPKETELMATQGAGREIVRRAVIQLTAEGLVEPVRRRGTVVRVRPARRPVSRSRLVYRDELGYYFDRAGRRSAQYRCRHQPAREMSISDVRLAGAVGSIRSAHV